MVSSLASNVIEQQDIKVFSSAAEISHISFPTSLNSMLLAVCGNGEITGRIDVVTRRIGANQLMVLRPGHLVDRFETSSDFRGFFITVSSESLHTMLPSFQYVIPYSLLYSHNPIIDISREEYDALTLIYDLFRRHLRTVERPFGTMALESLCELLFFNTLSLYAQRTRDVGHKSRREELLTRFMDTLERHFRVERSVNFYADALFVTPKHLSAVLKEVSGQTAGEWIDNRVILEAKKMLRTTGMNILEISSALNFSNQSFFGKYFKHLTGISPREYRNNLSGI
ncbi:MAG: AraC family transcriptional regulator [Duncaniella sp.]|nr:AraC family transcriptional regulator [Duncaniella sp.]